MVMRHVDLFSGIGGFAYAFREVFGNEGKTILFCDNDKYCQAVLRKHWSEVPIWGDIRKLIADTKRTDGKFNKTESAEQTQIGVRISQGFIADTKCKSGRKRQRFNDNKDNTRHMEKISTDVSILTGGFPCQPFSHAGKRRGTSDDRFLWPEMLECIRLFKPTWVIAENVHGILNIEGGLVFEQVCSDMEKEGYEVWPFIIPACAVNAPHRRDRVWIVAKSNNAGQYRSFKRKHIESRSKESTRKEDVCKSIKGNNNAPNTTGIRQTKQEKIRKLARSRFTKFNKWDWQSDWKEVAFRTCVHGVDDGIARWMDEVRISQAKHRTERLKMCGNGIVPQVAMEIMRVIKDVGNG